MTSPASPHNRRNEEPNSPSSAPTSAWAATRDNEASRGHRSQTHASHSHASKEPAPSEPGDGDSSKQSMDGGQIALIVLVVLGVIASVVMLLVGSIAAMKIALLVLLWAAVLGMFLVVRYRRQAQSTQSTLKHREDVHQAELDRLAAQNDASAAWASASAPARQDAPNPDASGLSAADVEMLREIRSELADIKEQLEELAGREFTYEPAALRAEARRIMEIEAQTRNVEPEPADFNFTQSSFGAPTADAVAGRLGAEPTGASASSELRNIVAEHEREEAPEPKPEPTASAKKADRSAQSEEPPKKTFDTGSFQAVRWDRGGDETIRRETEARETVSHKSQHREEPHATEFKALHVELKEEDKPQQAEPTPTRRGRRRRDAGRSGAVSVAELLKANKKDK